MLDVLRPSVPGAFVVARLAEECRPCISAGYDDERNQVTIDEAVFDVEQGLCVLVGGKWFRLAVNAVPLTNAQRNVCLLAVAQNRQKQLTEEETLDYYWH